MAKTKAETTTLDRALRGTLVGIWAERLARAFWPFLSIALLLWAVLAFGVQARLLSGWAAFPPAVGFCGLRAPLALC